MNRIPLATVANIAAGISSEIDSSFVSGISNAEFRGTPDADNVTKKKSDGTDLPANRWSYGVCQVEPGEQSDVGVDGDLTDPTVNITVFCRLMERNKPSIISAAGWDASNLPRDFYYFLAWSHNGGLPAVLASINKYDANWNNFVKRNTSAPDSTSRDYVVNRLIPYARRAADNCPGDLLDATATSGASQDDSATDDSAGDDSASGYGASLAANAEVGADDPGDMRDGPADSNYGVAIGAGVVLLLIAIYIGSR